MVTSAPHVWIFSRPKHEKCFPVSTMMMMIQNNEDIYNVLLFLLKKHQQCFRLSSINIEYV